MKTRELKKNQKGKNDFHVQCHMEKRLKNGTNVVTKRVTSWIPEKYAKKDTFVKLKDNDVWEDGWKVISLGTKQNSEYVLERSRDWKKTREFSDI